ADHLATKALHQRGGRPGRATGGEHVVHDQYALTRTDAILVDLQHGRPVLERVLLSLGLPGQLARLADGHEPRPEVICHGRGEDETAGLDPHHLVDVAATVVHHDQVDGRGEAVIVGQQWRDVLEDDALLRKVGHL